MLRHSTLATSSSLRLVRGRGHCRPQLNPIQKHLQQHHQSPRVLATQLSQSRDARFFLKRSNEKMNLLLNLSEQLSTTLSRSDVFSKYIGYDLELPANKGELQRLLRPRIVLYFGLLDGRSLGQVVVQLYTEAAPLVVLQFIRTCRRQRAHEFAVRRIFPDLWLEGYLLGCNGQQERSADPPPLLRNPMEFDTRVLSHERHNCVLSCAKEYCVHGFPGGAINFSISFKPLSVANGQRVGFGRVVSGAKIIAGMQSYGTKNGKMCRPLVITHCDVL